MTLLVGQQEGPHTCKKTAPKIAKVCSAEYNCPAWAHSSHINHADVQLNTIMHAPQHWDLALHTIALATSSS